MWVAIAWSVTARLSNTCVSKMDFLNSEILEVPRLPFHFFFYIYNDSINTKLNITPVSDEFSCFGIGNKINKYMVKKITGLVQSAAQMRYCFYTFLLLINSPSS